MTNFLSKNKQKIGMVLFAVSIILLFAMFLLPSSHIVVDVDEYFSLGVIQLSGLNFWQAIISDVHPPLYYIIIQSVSNFINAFGIPIDTVFALKIVSIIPYMIILAISGTYLRKRYDWFTVGIFVFSLAVMSRFFYQFTLIRMYGWAVLFFVLIYIVYMNLIEKFDNRSWISLVILTVLSSYTHNILLISLTLVYLFVLLYILLAKDPKIRKKLQIKKWICCAIASVGLYVPWSLVLFYQTARRHSMATPPTATDYFNYLSYHMISFKDMTTDLIVFKILAVIFLILVVAIAFKKYHDNKSIENYELTSGILIYLLTLLVAGILVTATFKSLVVRTFLPSMSIFWLATSIMIGKLKNDRLVSLLLILIIVIGSFAIAKTMINENESYVKAVNTQGNFSIVNDGNVIIYSSLLQYNSYHPYFTNSTEYISEDFPIYLDTHPILESNLTKIVIDNPDKRVFIINKEKPSNLTDLKCKKLVHTGGSYIYELKLKNTQ